jgi:small subunit ribosomal protein S21
VFSRQGNERSVIGVTSEVKVRKGETIDKALRRLKKKLDREGIMREIRARRHFEKPSEKKRRKSARARGRARRA